MKLNLIHRIILFQFLSVCSYSQINSFDKKTDNNKTIYQTNSYQTDNEFYKNQSYDLIEKLRKDLLLKNKIDVDFIRNCMNKTKILENYKFLFIDFIINQDGEVLSCSLIDYGNEFNIQVKQINCILSNAMNIKFSFLKTPKKLDKFYIKVRKRFKP